MRVLSSAQWKVVTMKLATGSNPQIVLKKVSIQLALDGHSFSASDTFPGEGDLLVEVLTPRTMLVPSDLFESERAAELLAANGTPLAAGERAVWSDEREGLFAVMALGKEMLHNLTGGAEIRLHYTTPLLHTVSCDMPTVWMYRTAGLLYIKVYDRTLRFAEVIPAPAEADILYFADALGHEFPFGKYELRIAGSEKKSLYKLLNGWFRRTIAENDPKD